MDSYNLKTMAKHISRRNETLYKIANMFYLHWYLWPVIFRFNQHVLTDPWDLKPGVELSIPLLFTEPINHLASNSDDWYTLAVQYYGTADFYYYIQKENNYEQIYEGNTVIIPALVTRQDLRRAEELRNVCP